jgi:hypothetical protein
MQYALDCVEVMRKALELRKQSVPGEVSESFHVLMNAVWDMSWMVFDNPPIPRDEHVESIAVDCVP